MSISELAENCSCSEATVVRFARRLGLEGYQDLKISIASESGNNRINPSIDSSDTCFEIS
jgi:RpiR family glv operon transcriptional regulator